MPKPEPISPSARVRAGPSNSCASAAKPADSAMAPRRPCTPRRRSSTSTLGAKADGQRGDREASHADLEHALAAILVGERPAQHDAGADGEHEARDDPGQRGDAAAEIGADRGDRHRRAGEGDGNGDGDEEDGREKRATSSAPHREMRRSWLVFPNCLSPPLGAGQSRARSVRRERAPHASTAAGRHRRSRSVGIATEIIGP